MDSLLEGEGEVLEKVIVRELSCCLVAVQEQMVKVRHEISHSLPLSFIKVNILRYICLLSFIGPYFLYNCSQFI